MMRDLEKRLFSCGLPYKFAGFYRTDSQWPVTGSGRAPVYPTRLAAPGWCGSVIAGMIAV